MRIAPIVARLEAELRREVRQIDGVVGLAALDEQALVLPAAWVAPERETATSAARTGALRQLLTQRWAVVLMLGAARRRSGDAPAEVHDLAEQVKAALVGWRHPDAVSDTIYRGGRLLRAAQGIVAWQMDFEHEEEWSETS